LFLRYSAALLSFLLREALRHFDGRWHFALVHA
jgi:hypothetical protein